MRKTTAAATVAALLIGGVLAVPLLLDTPATPAASAAEQCGAGIPISTVNVSELPVQKVGAYGPKQLRNAAVIINEASKADVGRKGAVIALMTAMQESTLLNHANDGSFTRPPNSRVLSAPEWAKARTVVMDSMKYTHEAVGSDWDSIGLFQQRPSAGWGSVKEIMNPSYSAATFLTRMKRIQGWEKKPYGQVAQAVQISAFPDAYNKHQTTAENIADALASVSVTDSPSTDPAAGSCAKNTGNYDGTVSAAGWVQPLKTYSRIQGNYGESRGRYPHAGEDFSAPDGTAIYAAADGKVIRSTCNYSQLVIGRSPCQIEIDHGSENGQRIHTLYVHMFPEDLIAKTGQDVKAGEHIGNVGTNGNSTGYHLHFEIWKDGNPTSPMDFLTKHGVTLRP